MKLLTALGLSGALLVANGWTLPSALAGEPAGSLPREQICSSPVTDQYGNTSQMCETVLGNPVNPLSPAFKVCMGFSTSPVRYLYCLNLLGSVTPPTTTSKPIATPTPTPEPHNPECSSMADSLYFGGTTSRKTQIWWFVKPDEDVVVEDMWCYGFPITWVIQYKDGTKRRISDTLNSSNEAFYELYRPSKVRTIRVTYEYQPGNQGMSLTCSPKTKTCNTAPDKPSSPGCLACGDTFSP